MLKIKPAEQAIQTLGKHIFICERGLQGNSMGVRAIVFRLAPFVYTEGFSAIFDIMLKGAKQKGAASYVAAGKSLLIASLCVCVCCADRLGVLAFSS